MVQRQNASATGGTIPTLDRPIMKLPDQNRTASVNRTYGARQMPDNRECIEAARPDTRACAASSEGERERAIERRVGCGCANATACHLSILITIIEFLRAMIMLAI
jgi:hypothetical protein